MNSNLPLILLDSPQGGAILCTNPSQIIRATSIQEVPSALQQIDAAIAQGCHTAGFLSYELGYALEPKLNPLMPKNRQLPLIWLGVFKEVQQLTKDETTAFIKQNITGNGQISSSTPNATQTEYTKQFNKLQQYIKDGETYETNLTFKTKFTHSGCPFAIYQELRQRQPVQNGALILTPDFSILSLSPENFIQIEEGGTISTLPMKGTAPRGRYPKEDIKIAQSLQTDEKSRAENLMIVDLMRNDIGRIAQTGSVKISDEFHIQTLPTLHQMTTKVTAKLKPNTTPSALIQNLFPAGSITGAPKIRTQEIIHELENEPREVYTGSIGIFSPSKVTPTNNFTANLNVAIRTLLLHKNGAGEAGIGSGVVYDSSSLAEYQECLDKAKYLAKPTQNYQLIETIRYDSSQNQLTYLPEHLARLAYSAEVLNFAYTEEGATTYLNQLIKNLDKNADYRIRLELHKCGKFTSQIALFSPESATKAYQISIAKNAVNSSNIWLFHKTSNRELYEQHLQSAKQANPQIDEVILTNENNYITEGTYTNIFIKDETTNKLLTPPLSHGLLPGTLRQNLINTGQAIEKTITIEELIIASANKTLYIGNALRGLINAKLIIKLS